VRTFQRWMRSKQQGTLGDRRKTAAQQRVPGNALSPEERAEILRVSNQPEYRSLPPSQIVPRLADAGTYIASESSFYRVLRDAGQINRRGAAEAPREVPKPKGYCARQPNQVWSWDITFLASSVRGQFYRLYLIEDIYSRKIVGWEVHTEERAEHASVLISKACLAEGVRRNQLVLHADNDSPMKGATMLATLQRLGVVPSFSRPSVSDDNPFSERLFRRPTHASRLAAWKKRDAGCTSSSPGTTMSIVTARSSSQRRHSGTLAWIESCCSAGIGCIRRPRRGIQRGGPETRETVARQVPLG